MKGKINRKIISVLLVSTLILISVISPIFSHETDNLESSDLGESSSIATLGTSGTVISNIDDLVALSNRVANGDSCEGVRFTLVADLDLSTLTQWTPIGTAGSPFKGIFDGQGHFIKGVGSEVVRTLFGTIENARIENLTVKSVAGTKGSALVQFMYQSDIENTYIFSEEEGISSRLLRSTFTPGDQSWYTGAGPYQIDSPAKLLGLLDIVNAGTDDFEGDTIHISKDIDLGTVAGDWVGIGTAANPFKGTFSPKAGVSSVKISNMYAALPGQEGLGLFGHTENATIKGIHVINANIIGGDKVGALVGNMVDTEVRDCMSSGKVGGTTYVGGLIGEATATQTWTVTTPISWSYSTANVSGTVGIGGFIGRFLNNDSGGTFTIENCFTTGNVVGVIKVGGFIGMLDSANKVVIKHVATSGTINGSGLVGGIAGDGVEQTGAITYNLSGSYSTSTVYAFSDSGGLVGAHVNVEASYTSGHIVSPRVHDDGYNFIRSIIGYNGSSRNAFSEGNTVYRLDNYMNSIDSTTTAYRITGDSRFLDDYQNLPLPELDGDFENRDLTYGGDGAFPYDDDVAISGTYPQLKSFIDPSAPAAFKYFTQLTTSVAARSIPPRLYPSDSEGFLSATLGGKPLKLPTLTDVEWRVNGGTNVTVDDKTLENGNTIWLVKEGESTLIKTQAVASGEVELNLSAKVRPVDGFEVKYTTTLVDQSVRLLYGKKPSAIYYSIAEATAENSNYISGVDNIQYLEFGEPVDLKAGVTTVDIYEYDDNEFKNPPISVATATIRVINNTVAEIIWDGAVIKSDKGYRIDTDIILDKQGIAFDKMLYFRSPKVQKVEISFVDSANALPGSTPEHQLLEIIEKDPSFGLRGRFSGIGVGPKEYEAYRLLDSDLTGWTALKTAAGKGPYKDITVGADNFYMVPGEYRLTYQMAHPTDPKNTALASNILQRTYYVKGNGIITLGGKPATPIVENIDKNTLLDSYKDGDDIRLAVEKYLTNKYLTSTGAKHLEAYSYSSEGLRVDKKITLILDNIPQNALINGFQGLVFYEVEDYTQTIVNSDGSTVTQNIRVPMSISIGKVMPVKEIVVRGSVYEQNNTLDKSLARKHFDVVVIDKADPTTFLSDAVYYNWDEVELSRYDVPQEVTLHIKDGYEETVSGVDMSVTATATVVIRKAQRLVIGEEVLYDREIDRNLFWDTKAEFVRSGVYNRNHNFKVEYFDGAYAPADFLRAVANHENTVVNMEFPNSISLKISTENIDTAKIDQVFYDLNIEEMHSLYVKRDVGGAPVQSFNTSGKFKVPGIFTVSMPLDPLLVGKELKMYVINEQTNRYVYVRNIKTTEIKKNTLEILLTEFYGEVIITAVDLAGKTTSKAVSKSW